MRPLIAAAAALFLLPHVIPSQGALAQDLTLASQSSSPASDYVGGRGLLTALGPTGLFQNPTSGIVPKYAFSVQSCMSFKENNGDHFQTNGVLVTYGVTDWLEVGGFGLYVHGYDPAVYGDDHFEMGQVNARARLVRDEGGLPEITIGGIVGFGDDRPAQDSLYVSASKGFALSDGDIMRSVRVHAGLRETWRHLGDDYFTGFAGLELEVFRNLFLIGEVNFRDDSFNHTPWSAGLQYRSGDFGLSFALFQDPFNSDKTTWVGIGVSY